MSDPASQITTPAVKAATALGAGAGSSMTAIAAQSAQFLPTDLGGWMALAASSMAFVYSLCILAEWWWKKVWRPFAVRMGWMTKPKGTSFTVDEDGNVSRAPAP